MYTCTIKYTLFRIIITFRSLYTVYRVNMLPLYRIHIPYIVYTIYRYNVIVPIVPISII